MGSSGINDPTWVGHLETNLGLNLDPSLAKHAEENGVGLGRYCAGINTGGRAGSSASNSTGNRAYW